MTSPLAQVEDGNGSLNTPSWLRQLQGKTSSDLMWNSQFVSFLNEGLGRIELPLQTPGIASSIALDFLAGSPGIVEIVENRYLQVTVSKRRFGRNRAFLWIDSNAEEPTIGFVVRFYHRVREERVSIAINSGERSPEIPPQFLAHAIRWLQADTRSTIVEIAFYGSDGRVRRLEPHGFGQRPPTVPLQRKVKRRHRRGKQ